MERSEKDRIVELRVFVTVLRDYPQTEDEVLDSVTEALNDSAIMAYLELTREKA